MNRNEKESLKRENLRKIDIAYKKVDGAVRFSPTETLRHVQAKCECVYLLKKFGIFPDMLKEALKHDKNIRLSGDKEDIPICYTECRMSDGSVWDICLIYDNGRMARVEIVEKCEESITPYGKDTIIIRTEG